MNPTRDELDELTKEDTLLDVYRLVVRRLPRRPIYRWIVVGAYLLIVVAALSSSTTAGEIASRTREWALTFFNFAATVLCILLAGFPIFATIATSELVRPLVKIPEEKSGLSYLKYIAGRFMHVFIWYVLFLFVYAAVALFGWYGGPCTALGHLLAWLFGEDVARFATAMGLAFVGAFFVHLLIVLQSFIFNVYASFMFIAQANLEYAEWKRAEELAKSRTPSGAQPPPSDEEAPEEDVSSRGHFQA